MDTSGTTSAAGAGLEPGGLERRQTCMVQKHAIASRIACCALATLGLAACSSSGKSATPSTTVACATSTVLPDYSPNPGAVACLKSKFEQAVKNHPYDKYGWYNLGVIAQSAKDLPAAATDFEHAIAIDPKFEPPVYNLGIIRLQAGDYQAATPLLTRAVALAPNDANAHWNLGTALARFHTAAASAKATVELNTALRLDPKLITKVPPPVANRTKQTTTSTT